MRAAGLGIDAELAQHRVDVALLGLGILMRDVADMQDDVRLQHLFQRGAERGDELRRQVGDEADRVRQHRLAAMRQGQRAQGRIERREQHVGGLHVGAGQAVEQRRLAGVGVADQRDHAIRHALPAGAMQPPRRLHLLQFVLAARTMRSPIRRRSASIWVSPGPPMKPKPPRWRSRWVQERTRRLRW